MIDAPDNLDVTGVAVFLDVDGTLLDIQDNPAEVSADRELIGILDACREALGGAMSLVSGRSIAEIDRIFAPTVFPVAGAHGAELRIDAGRMKTILPEPLPAGAIAALDAFAAARDGLLVEKKHGGVSLHYRRAPGLEDECRRIATGLLDELGTDYRLIAGKMVFEIAPAGQSKGTAICAFLEEPPFAGRVPVFVGDDVTDEDGFRRVNELAGISIRVGSGKETAAHHSLPDVEAVRHWLCTAILANYDNLETGVRLS